MFWVCKVGRMDGNRRGLTNFARYAIWEIWENGFVKTMQRILTLQSRCVPV